MMKLSKMDAMFIRESLEYGVSLAVNNLKNPKLKLPERTDLEMVKSRIELAIEILKHLDEASHE